MPVPAYMTIEGENQGEMSAGCCSEDSLGTLSREDKEDFIQIQEFRHSIEVPTDPQSGQPVGPRQHKEVTFVKAQDQSTPLLYQALNTGERITSAEIEWYRINAAGEEEHYFTTTIENARITNIRSYMPEIITPAPKNVKIQTPRNYKVTDARGDAVSTVQGKEVIAENPRVHMEEVTMRYRTITWTHEICGTEGTDDWDGEE